jgi:hypothetical protein
MFGSNRSGLFLWRSILVRYGYSDTVGDMNELYVGAGDRFDDDRRVVRRVAAFRRRYAPFGALRLVPTVAFRRRPSGGHPQD